MSDQQIKKLARNYMSEQKKILKEHGDSVVHAKYGEAVASVEKIFRAIAKDAKSTAQAKS